MSESIRETHEPTVVHSLERRTSSGQKQPMPSTTLRRQRPFEAFLSCDVVNLDVTVALEGELVFYGINRHRTEYVSLFGRHDGDGRGLIPKW